MSQSNSRGLRGKSVVSHDRNLLDLPENVGNRRSFEEMRIPPDNVGNMIEQDPIATFVHDGLGNSTEEEPAHLKSGILTHISGVKDRHQHRKPFTKDVRFDAQVPKARVFAKSVPKRIEPTTIAGNGDEYMGNLIKEFAKLLSEKSGLPFAFSMDLISDDNLDEATENKNLLSLKTLIEEILQRTSIKAVIEFSQYCTTNHRFAVFFINPVERDPAKNKELISALRQIVKLHAQKFPPGQVNVLLVLANAESIIEGHLYKLGAKKI